MQGILVKVSVGQVKYAVVEFDAQRADFLVGPDETITGSKVSAWDSSVEHGYGRTFSSLSKQPLITW